MFLVVTPNLCFFLEGTGRPTYIQFVTGLLSSTRRTLGYFYQSLQVCVLEDLHYNKRDSATIQT